MRGGRPAKSYGRGQGRGRGRHNLIKPGQRPVSEAARIDITEQLEEFQQSDETEYTFEAELSNDDRAVVHAECQKYGFRSKSNGVGRNRRVTIHKTLGVRQKHLEEVFDVPFLHSSISRLQSHFQAHPLQPSEQASLAGGALNELTAPSAAGPNTVTGSRRFREPSPDGQLLYDPLGIRRIAAHEARQASAEGRAMAQARAKLPITDFRKKITQAIAAHQVLLVAGATGCGKSTQVPQFILEEAWGAQEGCRIMVAQPRRISAITLATRVASERCTSLGGDVGYTIRLENKAGPETSLVFCTNGILLRMLTQPQGLDRVTHLVMDEVHERDCFADFLLIVLKQVLPKHPKLRLVLMSATLQADLFSEYFGGCPVIQVPGFMHPVERHYLEDILGMLNQTSHASQAAQEHGGTDPAYGAEVEAAIQAAFLDGTDEDFQELLELTGAAEGSDMGLSSPYINHRHPATGATPLMVAAGKGRLSEVLTLLANGADAMLASRDGSTAAQWAHKMGFPAVGQAITTHLEEVQQAAAGMARAAMLSQYQREADADEVDLELILALLRHLCQGSEGRLGATSKGTHGAVLVFLPGWDEISRLRQLLEADIFTSRDYLILPLHSMVPPADQKAVFRAAPPGVRKIVLATNIAETAVTIDDVVCVVDSGRVKEKGYDPFTAVGTLQASWISRASEQQRAGRAGRTQPGVCYHLYSKARSEAFIPFQIPELQRTPLEELCLQVKLLQGEHVGSIRIEDFLALALEAPSSQAVTQALTLLEDLGALVPEQQALTPLGRHLAALPLPPRMGKLLLYAIMFACLDPLLTVACFAAFRDPWVLPMDAAARSAAAKARQRLADAQGGFSDHLAMVEAFREWDMQGSPAKAAAYARANFVSAATMAMVSGMRKQVLQELQARGFVSSLAAASANAYDSALVRSVLAAGLYPQLGRVLPAPRRGPPSLLTSRGQKASIQMSSVNSSMPRPEPPRRSQRPIICPLVAFGELTRSEGRLLVPQSTTVGAHLLLLVALQLKPLQDLSLGDGPDEQQNVAGVADSLVLADEWLSLRAPEDCLQACLCLRLRLSACLAAKVQQPRARLSAMQQDALDAVADVFRLEGGGRLPGSPRQQLLMEADMAPECLQQRPPEAPFGRSNGYRGRGRLQEQGRGSRGSPGTFRGRGPRSHGSFSNSMPPGFGGPQHIR